MKVIIDIGSQKGQEISYFLNRNTEIHSFEPHPIYFSKLRSKFSYYKNVYLNKSAAWIKKEKQLLHFKGCCFDDNGGASLNHYKNNILYVDKNKSKHPRSQALMNYWVDRADSVHRYFEIFYANRSVEVQCIDIAEYIYSLQKYIYLLKIDAEGSEYEILEHLLVSLGKYFLKYNIENIAIEDHSRKFNSTTDKCNAEYMIKWQEKRKKVLQQYKEHNIILYDWDTFLN